MRFYQLSPGARFEFLGKDYRKVAMGMAEDCHQNGNVFWSGTDVNPIGEPLLLPEAEAELWKPDESSPWTIFIRSLGKNQE